jgi:hypothetical protein
MLRKRRQSSTIDQTKPKKEIIDLTIGSEQFQPPTMAEFLEDIERRRGQSTLCCGNPLAFFNFLAETGQEEDHPQLIVAREMALAAIGIYADATPTMAWHFHFGDMNNFFRAKDARDALALA